MSKMVTNRSFLNLIKHIKVNYGRLAAVLTLIQAMFITLDLHVFPKKKTSHQFLKKNNEGDEIKTKHKIKTKHFCYDCTTMMDKKHKQEHTR